MDVSALSAVEAAQRISDGTISSEALVQSCLNRIDQFEADIGAWAHLDPEYALEQARSADLRRQSGRPTGPLHGVPVGIKDIIDTADFPTECGTPLREGRNPPDNAAVIDLLREAGAIILGKTVTSELAVYAPGKTRNPHDPERTPGGSSSGSAAAVAAFMTPLAVGTQTNGSIIRPASFCGVFGFKPSYASISRHGVLSQSRRLDTVGVFARNLADLSLIADVLMTYDARDTDMTPRARPQINRLMMQAPPVDPRFALVRSPVWDRAEDYTRDAFRELTESGLANIDIVDLPGVFASALDDLKLIMEVDLARSYAGFYRDGADQLSTRLREMIESGQRAGAADYLEAVDRMSLYRALLDETFDEYDAILTPSAPGVAPEYSSTGDPAFCSIWSLCGLPTINLPIFQGPDNLPFGAQLVGAGGDDGRLFRSAHWLLQQLDSSPET